MRLLDGGNLPRSMRWPPEMFVTIQWERRGLAVPLAQLQPVHADAQTREAVEDWLYRVRMGYQF